MGGRNRKNREMRLLLAGGGLLIISAVLQVLARKTGWFGQWYAQWVYPWLSGTLARFFGLFPFPVGELLLYFLLISCVLYGFCHLGQWKKIVSGTLFLISLLFFIYTVNCGINYYRRPFSDYLEYRAGRYSEKELEELLGWLTQRVNAVYTETGGQERRKVQNEAVKAMEKQGE